MNIKQYLLENTSSIINLYIKQRLDIENEQLLTSLKQQNFKELIITDTFTIITDVIDPELFITALEELSIEASVLEDLSNLPDLQDTQTRDIPKEPPLEESKSKDLNGLKIITSKSEAEEELSTLQHRLEELPLGEQISITNELNSFQIDMVKTSDTKVSYTSPNHANSGILTFEEAQSKAIEECESSL